MIWNKENERRLKEYWLAGFSGSQIAQKLKITRSAVLGKARRMNLPNRKDGKRPVKERKQTSSIGHLNLMEAVMALKDGLCHYPIGHVDKPKFRFCLAEAVHRERYCSEHKDLCFVPKKSP